jgi:hypothetical protein
VPLSNKSLNHCFDFEIIFANFFRQFPPKIIQNNQNIAIFKIAILVLQSCCSHQKILITTLTPDRYGIMALPQFVEQHYVGRHYVEQHYVERHFIEQHFVELFFVEFLVRQTTFRQTFTTLNPSFLIFFFVKC